MDPKPWEDGYDEEVLPMLTKEAADAFVAWKKLATDICHFGEKDGGWPIMEKEEENDEK
jgi:hypothetical protein